jgi:hypothetical protein
MHRSAVIIPTRANDGSVLDLLLSIAADNTLENAAVVVVANGPSIDEEIFAALGDIEAVGAGTRIHLLRTEKPSKPRAINMGEEALGTAAEVTIYLDDDVSILEGSIADLVDALARRGDRPTLAGPRRAPDPRDSGLAQMFARSVLRPRWIREGVCLGGCYAVNRAGRLFWDSFPLIACDDEYVFSRFSHADRLMVPACVVSHPFAGTLRELLEQQGRWRQATDELHESGLAGPFVGTGRSRQDVLEEALRARTLLGMIFVRGVRLWALARGRREELVDGAW